MSNISLAADVISASKTEKPPSESGRIFLIEENGKLVGKIPVINATGNVAGYQTIDAHQQLRAIQNNLEEIKREVCSYTIKPSSVSISTFFASVTWDVSELCK